MRTDFTRGRGRRHLDVARPRGRLIHPLDGRQVLGPRAHAARQHGHAYCPGPLLSARVRLLRSGRRRQLWAARHSPQERRGRPTGRPATASDARASRLRIVHSTAFGHPGVSSTRRRASSTREAASARVPSLSIWSRGTRTRSHSCSSRRTTARRRRARATSSTRSGCAAPAARRRAYRHRRACRNRRVYRRRACRRRACTTSSM